MKRRFNVTGTCSPQRYSMVRLDERLKKIKEDYIDYDSYFVINRGRQYGKTITLRALAKYLSGDYIVLSLDFQQMGTEDFADAGTFVHAFVNALIEKLEINGMDDRKELMEPLMEVANRDGNSLKDLFTRLSRMCRNSTQPIVLIIDEVDSAGNHQVFIDFLAQLCVAITLYGTRCHFHRDKGYLLSFNFNRKKEIGVKEIQAGGKTIVEAVV